MARSSLCSLRQVRRRVASPAFQSIVMDSKVQSCISFRPTPQRLTLLQLGSQGRRPTNPENKSPIEREVDPEIVEPLLVDFGIMFEAGDFPTGRIHDRSPIEWPWTVSTPDGYPGIVHFPDAGDSVAPVASHS